MLGKHSIGIPVSMVSRGGGPGNTAVSKVRGTGRGNPAVLLPSPRRTLFKRTLVLRNALPNYIPGSKKLGEHPILKHLERLLIFL